MDRDPDVLRNDDFHPLEPLLDDLADSGLCVNLNEKVHREAGFVFCGMNHVRNYPFGYKHWCAPDGDFVACPVRFCGEGLTLDGEGRWIRLTNLREYHHLLDAYCTPIALNTASTGSA